MPRTYTPLSKKTAAVIDGLMKKSTSVWEYRRLQCVSLRQFGMQARDVAKIVKLHQDSVLHIWSTFQRKGMDAILHEKRGLARGRARWTREEERAFIQPFIDRAERGKLTTVREVYKAQCAQVGKTLDPTVTYRLLGRHGWRKVVPRPRHPKTNQLAQEQFKVFFPQRDHTGKNRSAPLWAPFPVDVQ